MKLVVGTPNVIISVYRNYKYKSFIFNIGSLYQQIPIERLSSLIPTSSVFIQSEVGLEDRNFDLWYANYLLTDVNAFKALMKIIYPLYCGDDVFCIIDRDDYRELFLESILKFIQQRYGFNGYVISENDDFNYISDSSFSISGLYNLDIDKERYAILCQQENYIQQ